MNDLIEFLQKVIAIDSSTREGAVQCLHTVLDFAQELGFAVGNMADRVGWAEYGQGEELVAVLGHLDVVPAGEGWTKNPFGGEIAHQRLYGRGATDDKGPILASLFALKELKDSKIPLKRRVRILFGTEEETGCADMKHYVENGGALPTYGFTPDGEFPLIHGEKGLIIEEYVCDFTDSGIASIWGGTAANIVPDMAYAVLADGTKIQCCGMAAHGAEPWNGVNAIGKLMARLDALPFTGQTRTAIHFLNRRIGLEADGASLGIAMDDAISGKLSFNLGMVRMTENSLSVTVNYRYPVTKCYADCAPQVRAAFQSAGFRCVRAEHEEKLFIPESSPLVQTLIGVYNQYTGENARPICIGGGTYAKTMPNTLAFGPIFPGDAVTEHKPDEYIALSRLQQSFDMIKLAILTLANQ